MKSHIALSLTIIFLTSACSDSNTSTSTQDAGDTNATSQSTISTASKSTPEVIIDASTEAINQTENTMTATAEEANSMTDAVMGMAKDKAVEYVSENKDDLMGMAKDKAASMIQVETTEMAKAQAMDMAKEEATDMAKDQAESVVTDKAAGLLKGKF
jgi:hypothetical protein